MPALATGLLLAACSEQESGQTTPELAVEAVAGQIQAPPDPDSGVDWRPWSAEAFAAARRLQRPVLLYAARTGCDGLFGGDDPLARWYAETRYIPVRIDPDRHPAVARRYAAAGCPSLSILLESGQEIVRATDIRRENVPLLLSRIDRHLQKRPGVVEKAAARDRAARSPAHRHAVNVAAVRAAAVAAYDTLYGGFGGPFKFPETQVLAFLQELTTNRGHDGAARMVGRTLDGLLASPLWSGDVQAMSHTPDWQTPRHEAFAADQAGLLVVLGRAAEGSANYRRAGQQLFDAIAADWYDAQRRAFRSRRLTGPADPGWTAPVIQADANALLIRACLQTAPILDREATARRQAVAAGETLLEHLVAADGAVYHAQGEDAPAGLLRDQMLVALAFGDLARLTGRDDFSAGALRVRRWADDHLWDERSGAFADGPARSWPASWDAGFDDDDDRGPAGTALAAEALAAAGDTLRALRVLHGKRLHAPADRRHAASARQLLILERSE